MDKFACPHCGGSQVAPVQSPEFSLTHAGVEVLMFCAGRCQKEFVEHYRAYKVTKSSRRFAANRPS